MPPHINTAKAFLIQLNLEVWVWSLALITLALSNPELHHFTLCPLSNFGLDWCPGCGLGRSIGLLFEGRFIDSFQMHPLGSIAVGLLLHRIISLVRLQLFI
jgi:hypothetical protein